MANTRHRNQLLLLAVALAFVLLVGSADAWQNCKKGYKTCKPNKHPGCETCIDNDPHNCGDCGIVCKYGECKYGKCSQPPPPKCPSGYGDCDGKRYNGCEKDLRTDPYNCGKCGNKCKYGCKCKYGKGSEPPPKCPPGYGDCDGKSHNGCEKDLRHDIYNCGKCGYKCPCTLKWGEPTCNWGKCGQQCKHGWNYDHVKKCCVQGH